MHASTLKALGWKSSGPVGSKIYYRSLGPLSLAKIQRPKKLDLSWIHAFRKQHHTFTTYLEPGLTTKLPGKGLGISVEPFAHSSTSLIDISYPLPIILKSFTQKTRYNITRNLKKAELSIISTKLADLTPEQINAFFTLHKSWSKQKHVVGHPPNFIRAVFKSYANNGYLHLCYKNDNLIGTLLILLYDQVATYYLAYASPLGYKAFAPTLLTWAGIQTAKKHGCDIFDFGGIYDPRYPKLYKNWVGFTKFKAGFNPTVVSYPPTTLKLFW